MISIAIGFQANSSTPSGISCGRTLIRRARPPYKPSVIDLLISVIVLYYIF